MSCVLLSLNQLEKYLSEGLKDVRFNNTDSQYTFMTCISLIRALEVMKKRELALYSELVANLDEILSSGVYQLELDQFEMVNALEQSDFNDEYVNQEMNPFDIANILSIAFNDSCWGDSDELMRQL